MIMLCHKTLVIKQTSPFEEGLRKKTDKLLFQLHEGIQMILNALENYSTANEALTGMRGKLPRLWRNVDEILTSNFKDQIRMAIDSVAAIQN